MGYDDFIIHEFTNGKKIKKYRSYCTACDKDKGYVRKNRLGKICHACNALKAKETGKNWAGKEKDVIEKIKEARKKQVIVHSEETKQKISNSNKITKHKLQIEKFGFIRDDKQRRIRKNFSSLMTMRLRRRLLSKANNSTFDCLDYDIDDVIRHLESQFQEGMSWDNYGRGLGKWSIDHIVPDANFNYKQYGDEEFIECWSLDNLQPMWHEENSSKGDRCDI